MRVLATLSNDPGYYHERIIGAEAFAGRYIIGTADGDEYLEDFRWWDKVWLLTAVGCGRHLLDVTEPR